MYTINMKLHWFGLLVMLINNCEKCLAMSSGELEDFTNYLHETSKLDHIHSKMNPFIPYNSDEKSNDEDDLALDNAWEESGKFEGDLILNDKQRKTIVDEVSLFARNGLRDSTKKWPNNEVIYYIQKEHFNEAQIQAIEDGIEDLGRASCVKFRPYKKGDRDAVVIQGSRRGCFSQVGYQGGYQVLNLSGRHPPGRGCFRHGTVVHELLHTLGFYHMQSSPDRDDYIDVAWENIIERAKHNFRKYNTFSVSDFGVGYDYESVLHYSRKAFSSNGQDTLIPKKNGAEIGQRIGLSDKDTQKLQKMYCDSDSNNYEADESTNLKLPAKKNVAKNIPFKGNGIGYHQGKTVIIKLPESKPLPQAKLPSYSASDYFSKLPLSTSPKGFGIVEEVDYNYDPWYKEILQINKDKPVVKQYSSKNATNQINSEQNVTKVNKINKSNEQEDKNKEKIELDFIERGNLIEAFERLGKIIKSLPPSVIGIDSVPTDEKVNSTALQEKSEKKSKFQQNRDVMALSLKTDEHSNSDAMDVKSLMKNLHGLAHNSNPFYDKNNMNHRIINKKTTQDQEKGRVPEINESYGTTYPFKDKYKNFYEDYKFVPKLENLRKPYDYKYLTNQQDNMNISDYKGLLDMYQRLRSTDIPITNSYEGKYILSSSPMINKDTSYSWPARSSILNVSYDEISHEIGDGNESQDTVKSNLKFDTMLPTERDWNDKVSLLTYEYPINYSSRESFETSKEQDMYLNEKFEQYKAPHSKESNKFYDINEGDLNPNKTIAEITKYTYSSEKSEDDDNDNSSFKPLNYEVTEKIDEITEKSHTKPFILAKKKPITTTIVISKPKKVKKTQNYETSSIQSQSMEDKLESILKGYGHFEDYDTKAPFEKRFDHYEYH